MTNITLNTQPMQVKTFHKYYCSIVLYDKNILNVSKKYTFVLNEINSKLIMSKAKTSLKRSKRFFSRDNDKGYFMLTELLFFFQW